MKSKDLYVKCFCLIVCYSHLANAAVAGIFKSGGIQYTFHSDDPLPFDRALEVCQQDGGGLVHITSDTIQQYLTRQIRALNLPRRQGSECVFYENGFWTGGIYLTGRVVDEQNIFENSNWMWGQQGPIIPLNSPFWAFGEPDDGNQANSAIELVGDLNATCRVNDNEEVAIGQWVDLSKNRERNFICQKDIDECFQSFAFHNCHDNAKCQNTEGSFTCSCDVGYTGNGVNCTDINECVFDHQICNKNAYCTNTKGFFTCSCNSGYTGDGITCNDIDECNLDSNVCGKNAQCTNNDGLFECSCYSGYADNGSECVDIDECELLIDICNRKTGFCVNTNGSYSCQCNRGYTGNGTTCKDINECEEVKGICGDNRPCIDLPGSYQCICEPGFSGDSIVRCRGYCQAIVVNGFQFRITQYGELGKSTQVCSNGIPNATLTCEKKRISPLLIYFVFEPSTLRLLDCEKPLTTVLNLTPDQLSDKSDVELFALELEIYTSVFRSQLTVDNIQTSARHIRSIAGHFKEGILPISVNTLNSIFQASTTVTLELPNQENLQGVGTDLSEGLTTFLQYINITEEEFELETSAMVVRAKEVGLEKELRYQPLDSNNNKVNVLIPQSVLRDAVRLREGGRIKRQIENKQLRTSFLFYKNNNLFETRQDNVSTVLSIDLGQNLTIRNLEEPIIIQHPGVKSRYGTKPISNNTLKLLRTKMTCVFWDFETSEWSSEGCCLNVNMDPPQCSCNHLTNFAILVKSDEIPSDVPLSVVSLVGSILSIVGLFFTLVLSVANRDARKRRPTKILLNICLNLFISNIIFVTGISRTENKNLCKTVAVFLQYFFLVTWCWMAAYSYEMYMSLVKVFRDSVSFYLQRLAVFAYVTPALVVILNVGITFGYLDKIPSDVICNEEKDPLRESTYLANNSCWLRDNSLYFGFLLPIGLILFYNFYVFIMVFRDLAKNKSSQSSNLKRSVKESLPIAISMTAIMGLTWLFGFFLLVSDDVLYVTILSWLFAITNTLQGFTIFILTCVKSQSMRQFWYLPIYRFVTSAVNSLSTTSTSEGHYDRSISSGGMQVSKSLRKSEYEHNNSIKASETVKTFEQNKV